MLGHVFSNDTIRNYIFAFGTLFNDIILERENAGVVVERFLVPITYSAKNKMLSRIQGAPSLTPGESQQVAIVLPRIGFELQSVTYDPARKLNTMGRNTTAFSGSANNELHTVYNPVPYDFNFQLSIYSKTGEDAARIVEDIVPFFTPELTITLNTIHEPDTPVILSSVTKEDSYEGDFETRRTIIWTLDFILKGYVYGPTTTNKGIIKRVFIDYFIPASVGATITGLAQSGTTSTILLAQTASDIDGTYKNGTIKIVAGTSSGDERRVVGYVGNSREVTVDSAWTATPDTTSQYELNYAVDKSVAITSQQMAAATTASRTHITPGLDANGNPTTNASITVSPEIINEDDDYGFVSNNTFFVSHPTLAGTRRNLKTGVDE